MANQQLVGGGSQDRVLPGSENGTRTSYRTWIFRLDREGAKREALEPAIDGLPFWTVGRTGGGGTIRHRLVDAVIAEDWTLADRLWWSLVVEALDENVAMLREEAESPAPDPLDHHQEAEDIVLAHLRAEQPYLLAPEEVETPWIVRYSHRSPSGTGQVEISAVSEESAGCRVVDRLKQGGMTHIEIESIEPRRGAVL